MRILIVGAAGMLGHTLVPSAQAAGHQVIARDIDTIDLTDAAVTTAIVTGDGPDVVINCAAWTDVDGAEEHEDRALAVNATGAGNLAAAAALNGARVLQLSTDYVFPGDASKPYVESDPTGPRSAYGRTKLAGEVAVAAANPNHAIVRTAWLYGAGGKNFVDTMLSLGAARDEVRVVNDQVGCPTWTGHLSPALLQLAASAATGTFHATSAGQCSWFDLASAALASVGSPCRVEPITTAEFPRPAPRPAFSVLATERGPDAITLPNWRAGLQGHLDALPTTPGEAS